MTKKPSAIEIKTKCIHEFCCKYRIYLTKEGLSFLYSTAEEGLCVWAEIFIFVPFSSLYVLATLTRRPDDALVSLR